MHNRVRWIGGLSLWRQRQRLAADDMVQGNHRCVASDRLLQCHRGRHAEEVAASPLIASSRSHEEHVVRVELHQAHLGPLVAPERCSPCFFASLTGLSEHRRVERERDQGRGGGGGLEKGGKLGLRPCGSMGPRCNEQAQKQGLCSIFWYRNNESN